MADVLSVAILIAIFCTWDAINQLKSKQEQIMATIDEVLEQIERAKAGIDALEAKIAAALANQGIPADVQAKIDQAFTEAKAAADEANA